MGFEVLTTNARKGAPPLVGFTNAKNITFNSALTTKYHLKEKKFIQILIDLSLNKIKVGFKFPETPGENVLSLTQSENGGCFCSGNSLISKLEINKDKIKEKKFEPILQKYGNESLLVIEIDKEEYQ